MRSASRTSAIVFPDPPLCTDAPEKRRLTGPGLGDCPLLQASRTDQTLLRPNARLPIAAQIFRWLLCGILVWLGLAVTDIRSAPATAASAAPIPIGESTQRFPGLPEHAEADELKARLHCVENPGPFQPDLDSFLLQIPSAYRPDGSWGLFVWISPSDSPRLPKEWLRVLEQRRLLFIGAHKSGNQRPILDRIRLAVCARWGMCERFKLNPKRLYISGFSGGGRVASLVGVAYADLFGGSIPFMGVNFYTDLPSADGTRLHPPQYIPHEVVLDLAKTTTRHALVTAEKDFNRAEVQMVFKKGYQKEGFHAVEYLEVPALGHTLPPSDWLDRALRFLDHPKP